MTMIDLATVLKTLLYEEWLEDDPAKADVAFTLDEFDPNQCYPQILLRNTKDSQTWVTAQLYRCEQEALISIYLRPVNYMETTIDATKTSFENVKAEIVKIISSNSLANVSHIEFSGWTDEPKGHGFDTEVTDEPIEFKSKIIVKITYFLDGGVLGGSPPVGPLFLLNNNFDYLVFYDTYYTAINHRGIITFGGQDDAGGVDGDAAAAVVNACFNALPNGGLVFLFNSITTTSSILMKDNIWFVAKSMMGSAGNVLPNITYTGNDYAIKEADEDTWKNFGLENLAIHNSNVSAKGHIRAGKTDFVTLTRICLAGYASESAINIPYSSLKGNSKRLESIRIEGEYHIAIGIDIQADHIYADNVVVSKTTSAAVRVGDQAQEESLYDCRLNNIHGYNCQHRFLDIQWSYYLLGTKLQDEHDANWEGTKESSWYQAGGKESKNNLLIDCIAAYNVGEGHPPAPYVELLDESGELVFIRNDTPSWGDQHHGLKVIPRLIVDDNGRGTPDVVTISTTHEDVLRLRHYDVKDIIFSITAESFKLWNASDERVEFQFKWGDELNLYNIIPFYTEQYSLGSSTVKWKEIHVADLYVYGAVIHALTPSDDNSISLGNDDKRWATVRGYFGKFDVLSILGNISVDGYGDVGSLKIAGTEVISSARTLHNVDINAGQLNAGTVPDARLSGATGGVTVRNATGDGTITLYFENGLFKYAVG